MKQVQIAEKRLAMRTSEWSSLATVQDELLHFPDVARVNSFHQLVSEVFSAFGAIGTLGTFSAVGANVGNVGYVSSWSRG